MAQTVAEFAELMRPIPRGTAIKSCIHVLGGRPFRLPLLLLYTAISYAVFRGKVRSVDIHY
jgi:cytochrome bd-type quinol oxidase subunit 2